VINVSPYSIAKGDRGAFFLCEEGIKFTDGINVTPLPADVKVRNLLKRIYAENLLLAYGIVDDNSHQYILAVTVRGSSVNNYIIIYDWVYNNWSIMEREATCLNMLTSNVSDVWQNFSTYTWDQVAYIKWMDFVKAGSKRLVFGKSAGYTNEISLAHSNNGEAYDAFHETGWLELNGGDYTEVLRYQPHVSGLAGGTFTVEYKCDDQKTWNSTSDYTFQETNKIETPYIDLRTTCRRFKLKFSNNNANEFFNHYKGYIYHNPRGSR